ncbi:nuclear transport factor 2 family protein [Sphingomicrobium arenosum]|uniref:nuclear transport factor 2 family protein n=1 Tax=Sphingomicrobium arenosum TaxID=2233861 RepID=UPI002240F50E|nr:nuclear transport factor 2 family protein [Sphingomicrobium arenosum]
MSLTLLPAVALALAAAPMPEGDALTSTIETLDAKLFWNAFEGCDPDAVAPLIDADYRMVHDLVGIAADNREDFIAGMRRNCEGRAPGSANAGYKNRRLLTPGSRTITPLGDWGALEEAHHQFYERHDGEWQLTGGGRYLHIWRWTGDTFVLNETLSLDHGPAPAYPPQE